MDARPHPCCYARSSTVLTKQLEPQARSSWASKATAARFRFIQADMVSLHSAEVGNSEAEGEAASMRIWIRKPWRSPSRPTVPYDPTLHRSRSRWMWLQAVGTVSWLRHAHDCQDARIGCSCAGSVQFPAR